MSSTKRAFSAFLTAAMLVALAAPAAFAAKQSAADNTNFVNCTTAAVAGASGCSQVADGLSAVVLTVESDDGNVAADHIFISLGGATVTGTTGGLVVAGGGIDIADDEAAAGATITLRAPASPGTTTMTVYTFDSNGIASAEGTLTITWTATSGLGVSEANSLVKIVGNNLCDNNADADNTGADKTTVAAATAVGNADHTDATGVDLCVVVYSGNNTPISGATVSVTVTPVGLVNGAQATSAATDAAGFVAFNLTGSALPGTSTIAVSVTQGTTTTSFAPRTFVWSGVLSTLTLSNIGFVDVTDANAYVDAVALAGKDAAGNAVALGAVTFTSSPATGITVGAPDADGESDVTCSTSGTYTITAKQGSVTSNAITFICSTDDAATDTFTVAFDKANVAPGGSAKVVITVKNSAGQPVGDDGAGGVDTYDNADVIDLVSSGALGDFSGLANGKMEATYLAPFASGQVTVAVTLGSLGTKTATLTIGAPATSAGSALGVAPAGPFTTTTKVQARGKYVTFRFDLGTAAAGKPVTILAATKTGTTWSGFTAVTTRIADANGVVIYYARQSTATWKSYRAQESTTNVTPARQARWT